MQCDSQILHARERFPQTLLDAQQMMEVTSKVMPTCESGRLRINRSVIVSELTAQDPDAIAVRKIECSMSRLAHRENAVEHVNPECDGFSQLLGLPDPHQVPGPILGEQRTECFDNREELLFRLSHREPPPMA